MTSSPPGDAVLWCLRVQRRCRRLFRGRADRSSRAGSTRLSARVGRVARRWQTIWETSGGRASRPPPAAQVPAPRPGLSPLPACGSRGGPPGGGARSPGSTRRRGDTGGRACPTCNERATLAVSQSGAVPSQSSRFLFFPFYFFLETTQTVFVQRGVSLSRPPGGPELVLELKSQACCH